MIYFAIQFALALLYANLGEWLFHKYILHGLGKHPGSIWAFHYEHHAVCARNAMLDPSYRQLSLSGWNARVGELLVFFGALLLHLPLFWYWPAFGGGLYVALVLYYVKHRKAHLDPAWAKHHLNWHYEHHMNPGSGNWCVTWPWCDYLFGTRSKISDSDNAF